MKHLRLPLALVLIALLSACQPKMGRLLMPENGWTLAFHNVENLFDTINDPTINDEEFLPGSKVSWNTKRYQHKLSQTSKVIAAMDTFNFPHLVGLCEIENRKVLEDLVAQAHIKEAGYNIIHFEGSDDRGIETAMIYRPSFFKPLVQRPVKVFNEETKAAYRDILYVKGLVATTDTLHVFINHWTSRYGGRETTENARRLTGTVLKSVSDSILQAQPNSNIVIMGDFNDNPTDASLTEHLFALDPEKAVEANKLYNLSLRGFSAGNGTLYYNGWDMFDQIIVSGNLIEPTSGKIILDGTEIVKKDWMLFKGSNGVARPNRTMSGGKYFGGFSDHLAVMVRLKPLTNQE